MFQSTLPRGERPDRPQDEHRLGQFQSTLPRGERPLLAVEVTGIVGFNPRSRGGSDVLTVIISCGKTRERGLKHVIAPPSQALSKSLPPAGAWIETRIT